MTSREEGACFRNNCKHPVKIAPLHSTKHGICSAAPLVLVKLTLCRMKVCDKCACLPLVIHAVGKSLKFISHYSWKDAPDKLENSKIISVPGIGPKIYACLKLSSDKLVEDAKSCLMLCSLFPEDTEITINILFRLATATKLIHDDRSRVCAMLEILKSSSLLLEGKNEEHFKLHDTTRDVGRSIVVRDQKYSFLFVRCVLHLPDNSDYGTRKLFHSDLKRDDVHFYDYLVCPDGQTYITCGDKATTMYNNFGWFLLYVCKSQISCAPTCMFSSQQQFSLQPFRKLRTLFLEVCDITGIGRQILAFSPRI